MIVKPNFTRYRLSKVNFNTYTCKTFFLNPYSIDINFNELICKRLCSSFLLILLLNLFSSCWSLVEVGHMITREKATIGRHAMTKEPKSVTILKWKQRLNSGTIFSNLEYICILDYSIHNTLLYTMG